MSQVSKHSRTFSIIGIFATIIGYIFMLYRGYTLNEEISGKSQILKKLNLEISAKEKNLDEVKNKYEQINLKYKYGLSVENKIDLPSNVKIIQKSDSANALIDKLRTKQPIDSNVTVSYYSKTVEAEKITLSLKSLPYNLITKNPSETMRGHKTNSVWFGKKVQITDVKIIALALIRAGIPISAIRPYKNNDPNYKANIVEIGGDVRVKQLLIKPYTIYQIDTTSKFKRDIE